jgi:peptidoglycan/LPS O-acetylase OafA/YrhL
MAGVLPRVACVVCAIAALWLAFMTYNEVALAGFPDGHVTDYDKAADGPLGVFSYLAAGLGLLFLALAFWPIKARRRAIGLLVCLIGLVLIAVVVQLGVPWYFGTHLGLDNGIGG